MSTSTVMPGAAALPNSSETSSGASTPSPLFREMFAKVAMKGGLPGKTSGVASVKQQSHNSRNTSAEQADSAMSGVPEGKNGTLLARVMAQQKKAGGTSQNKEHRGLSLHKGRESKGEVKAGLSDGQLETELRSGSEILPVTDVSVREKSVKGSDTSDSKLEIPQAKKADDADVPALVALPAGLISAAMSAPAVQAIPHALATGMTEVKTQSAVTGAVAKTASDPVREILSALQDESTAQPEPRTAVVEGKPDGLRKNAGLTVDAMKEKVVTLVQPEITGLKAVPDKSEKTVTPGTANSPAQPDMSGDTKTAGLSVPVLSPDLKKAADAAAVVDTEVDKGQVTIARNEHGSATKQPQQDPKSAGKGETVMRELPSGVTVLNPAQTVAMGRPAMTAEAAPLAVQGSDRGHSARKDGEARNEKGRELPLTTESEKNLQKKEAFASQNNSNMSHDSEAKGGNQGFSQTVASSGSFDAVSKGDLTPLSDVPREHEVSALHENILSQVREKLVSHDPSGTVSKITLKLNPHELGELQIHVHMEDQKMKVDITAQNPVVKQALLQNIDHLKDTLMRQNISMERFHVSTGGGQGQAFNQSFRDGRQSAYQTPDTFSYPLSGYYQEDTQVSQAAVAESRENSLVDMRF